MSWPLEDRWNPAVAAPWDDYALIIRTVPIPWLLTDLAILIAPMPMIRKLHLPTKTKVALGGLFLIGGL